jgi:hypothetical protein
MMNELWNVLFECGLARKRGVNNSIDRKQLSHFMVNNELTEFIECSIADKHLVIRIGICSATTSKSDHAAAHQWKSGKRPPRPLREVADKFRVDLKEHFDLKDDATRQTELVAPSMPSTPSNTSNTLPMSATHASPSTTDSSSSSPRLSKPPTLPDTMDNPSACDETCELERKKKEDNDKRKKAVS